MSTTERGTIVQQPELFQKQKNSQALRWPFRVKINPDLAVICAFATIGVLLTACAAVAFPPWGEVLAWF
jgi:hypothetical protein